MPVSETVQERAITRRPLTDAQIRNAKPRERPYKLSDGGGLYVLVTPAGGKLFRFKYRFEGKEKLSAFGHYPEVSLLEAREKREAEKRLLREGRDPSAVKKREAAAERASAANTFERVAREWYEIQKGRWSETHAYDVLRSLERDVFPEIGNAPIRDLGAPRVREVLQKIADRPAVETAHRIRQRISEVFRYGMASSYCAADPADVLRRALPAIARGRQPAIVDLDGARQILRHAEAIPAQPVTKLALRLLALTAIRPGTLLTTPWGELNRISDGIWRIPPDRLKLAKRYKEDETREHLVPLARQALDVIDTLRKMTGRGLFVLPSPRNAHTPMSENAIGYFLHRAGYHSRHVPHGWRATFSTVMNERYPADRHIIDLMLAHVPKDKVEAAYNRAAHLDRRRELAQIWADLLLDDMPSAASLLNGPRR